MAQRSFTIYEEPHVADVGTPQLRFVPESTSDMLLEAWRQLDMDVPGRTPTSEGDEGGRAVSAIEREHVATVGLRAFVRAFLYDEESRAAFDGNTFPSRVYVQLQRWLLEVYSGLPTGPSSGSSDTSQPATSSDDSTDSTSGAA